MGTLNSSETIGVILLVIGAYLGVKRVSGWGWLIFIALFFF